MEHSILAKEILGFYAFEDPEIEFIRHSENMIYKIRDNHNNRNYLLRIHNPVSEGFSGIQHTLEGLRSEMALLKGLSASGTIQVQEPVANRFGELVTDYQSGEHGTQCFATLLTWMEGSMLSLEEGSMEEMAFALGKELGAFHEFTRQFNPAPSFIRPVYDAKRIDFAINELHYGVEIGLYQIEQLEMIKEVLHIVKQQLIQLDSRDKAWGIIHADLQLNNIIINNGRPGLIDFSLSGYGYYLFDLGSGSSILPKEVRKTFLEGYASKSNFSFDDIRYIEGLIFMDIFISYCFFIRDNNNNGWIANDVAALCGSQCKDFIEGKTVFYSF
ncbi:phosphotransferase enzyme family protein [Paenibacillus sp. NPDC058071]|uniref:phosphotransferase enzyme family protein n=1 Tax=Paenibacillus sp. NPDC058071 TaxID=3346326 RepID=UPI0036DC6E8F